jgi:hypothetical protein
VVTDRVTDKYFNHYRRAAVSGHAGASV